MLHSFSVSIYQGLRSTNLFVISFIIIIYRIIYLFALEAIAGHFKLSISFYFINKYPLIHLTAIPFFLSVFLNFLIHQALLTFFPFNSSFLSMLSLKYFLDKSNFYLTPNAYSPSFLITTNPIDSLM